MKRKTFIQMGSILSLGSLFLSSAACKLAKTKKAIKNWAGNITFSTENVAIPTSIQDIIGFVKNAKSIKAQGTRHCFNTIADSDTELIAMKEWNKNYTIDKTKNTVTVDAGMKYGELAPLLQKEGYALHNLASLPHISIAGSIATATHGSGVENGNLASTVVAIEFIDASGNTIQLSKEKDADQFYGAVVAIGAIGVVTKVSLQLMPAFNVSQFVYEQLPNETLYANFEKIMGAAYSVSLFTDWQNNYVNEIWVKANDAQSKNFNIQTAFFNAKPAAKEMHPISVNDPINCTPQLGVAGPWYERLPHFKMGFTPSSGVELQSEYFVPFEQATEAIKAVAALGKEIGPHLLITEIRSIAADDLWLSMAYHRKSIAIHFTWKQETEAVMQLLPKIEKALEPFAARPHWGKLFTISRDTLHTRYEKMDAFKQMAKQYDPNGKFVNAFLKENIFG